jgi:hypothetical protein
MAQTTRSTLIIIAAVTVLATGSYAYPQTRHQIKVVVETRQSGAHSEETLQGSGSVIIRRGTAQPSGRVTAGDRQTTVQRSTGIFTLVQDGGESILSVATRVPHNQISYYYNYATGIGYVDRHVVFTDVGTSLRVSATVLPDDQIRVRLIPQVSYFSAERSGAIDFTEAATELIVPNGQPLSLGGATSKVHELTRRILGYTERSGTSETNLTLTATIQ